MKLKYLFAVFIFLTITFSGKAQKSYWFDAESGMNIYTVQDMGHSSLVYMGPSLFYGLTLNKQGEKFISSLHLSSSGSQLSPSFLMEGTYDLNKATRSSSLIYYKMMKQTTINNVNISFGGSGSTYIDIISYDHGGANNPLSYELDFMLNPEFVAGRNFDDWINVSLAVSIPLLGYSIRPEAQGLFPMDNFSVSLGKIIGGGSLVTLNKLFILHTRLNAEFKISKMSIAAFYDYYGGVNKVSEHKGFATHQVGIQVPFLIRWK